jgi:hypothetical protein
MHHENLYQILYALTDVTGDDRYAKNADRALKWFFTYCQSPQTGLLPWGEEMFWDFLEDTTNGNTHEFWRPWVLWDQSFQLVPEECLKFAHGLWDHQIRDHETGDFSRHAAYHEHGPGSSSQYPRHGGFYIATWAKAYRQTEDPELLRAIKVLLGFYERNRSEQSGAIPAEIGQDRSRGNLMWPHSNLSLAIDLCESASMVPEKLAARMLDCAEQIDGVFLKIYHCPDLEGGGFVTQANTHTLAAEDVREICKRFYSDPWIAGYGHQSHAQIANQCMIRFRQTQKEGYKELIMKTADYYLNHEISFEFPVYPGTIGQVIWLMLNAYELTGDLNYLNRAEYFAGQAVGLFLADESSLPSATSEHHHYEAITRADTFMMSLLRLWAVQNRTDLELSLTWCDR